MKSMNTNDPAGEYRREPMPAEPHGALLEAIRQAATIAKCAAIVHDKITKGELMVVKTAHNLNKGHNFLCSECDKHVDDPAHGTDFNFCPGCGAKIVQG